MAQRRQLERERYAMDLTPEIRSADPLDDRFWLDRETFHVCCGCAPDGCCVPHGRCPSFQGRT